MAPIKISIPSDLSKDLYEALGSSIQGEVYLRNDPKCDYSSINIFNLLSYPQLH